VHTHRFTPNTWVPGSDPTAPRAPGSDSALCLRRPRVADDHKHRAITIVRQSQVGNRGMPCQQAHLDSLVTLATLVIPVTHRAPVSALASLGRRNVLSGLSQPSGPADLRTVDLRTGDGCHQPKGRDEASGGEGLDRSALVSTDLDAGRRRTEQEGDDAVVAG